MVLSRLATALGEESLFMASLEDTHRPEDAYAVRTFRPPPMRRGLEGELLQSVEEAEPVPEVLRERPSRVLTKPTTIDVEMTAAGELLSGHGPHHGPAVRQWLIGQRSLQQGLLTPGPAAAG